MCFTEREGNPMTRHANFLLKLAVDERGLETVEYGIIVGLIVAASVSAIGILGTWVKGVYDNLATSVGA